MYERKTALTDLGIPGTEPWVSRENLIALGKRKAMSALVRTTVRLTNLRNNLAGKSDEVSILRLALAQKALHEEMQLFAYVYARPDTFWQQQKRERFYVHPAYRDAREAA